MPFQPFKSALTDCRAIEIPRGLEGAARSRFVEGVRRALRKQTELAQQCDAILRPTGEPREEAGYLLVPHEPAAPADPELVVSAEQRPDIDTVWWLTWATLHAFRSAHEARMLHAGLQLGSLMRDQTGCLKIADFGIASVFEAACGIESRRYILCAVDDSADESGRPLSATWRQAREDEAREHGWISAHFAPELLQDQGGANLKTDQFSLGVLLFLWATGTHPYGAALSDPSLMFYFTLEPYALQDERADWRACFERQEKGLAQSTDQPVLAWWGLARRLLANEPGERYPNLADAEQAAGDYTPANWTEAAHAIATALALLDEGQVNACLSSAARWSEATTLPALWREPLAAFVARIESQRAVIEQRKALERRLGEGQGVLDRGDIEQARTIVSEVLEAPECDNALRQTADDLLRQCEEQEELIRSGADQLAREYIQSARDALDRQEFSEARLCLNAVLQDPASPRPRLEQAERMLAEVDQTEQRLRRQEADLAAALRAFEAGEYEQAAEKAAALLEDGPLSEAIAQRAEALRDEVRTAVARRAEYTQALDDARAAWERTDPQAAEELLATIPFDLDDASVVTRRDELSEACQHLRTALEHKQQALKQAESGDLAAALAQAQTAAGVPELPASLREELAGLSEQYQRILGERREAALTAAREALEGAQAALEHCDPDAAERQLARFPAEIEQSDLLRRRDELAEACQRLRSALTHKGRAAELLDGGDTLEAIVEVHKALELPGLPATVREELGELDQRCEQVIEQQRKALVEKALGALREAWQAFEAGNVDTCENQLESVFVVAESLPAEDHERARQLREACDRVRQAGQVLDRARRQLEADDFDGAVAALDELERKELPTRVAEDAAQLRKQIEQARLESIQKQRQQLSGRLDQAAQTLADGRLDDIEPVLTDVERSPHVSDELRARTAQLRKGLAGQRGMLNALSAAEAALEKGAADQARELLAKALPAELPDWLAERVALIRQRIEQIEQRKQQVAVEKASAALDAAATALERGDPVSAKRHLEQAAPALPLDASLAKRHRELTASAARLEEWIPKVAALEAAFREGQAVRVYRETATLQKDPSVPTPAAARLASLHKQVTTQIATRQKQITAELDQLAEQLGQRGRRARRLPDEVGKLQADPLATGDQKKQAAELLKRFEALPVEAKRRRVLPITIATASVVAVAVGVILIAPRIIGLLKSGNSQPNGPGGGGGTVVAADIVAGELTVNESGEVRFTYEVTGPASVDPFVITFFRRDQEDGIFSQGDQLGSVDGDAARGSHAARLPDPVDLSQGGFVGALIDTQRWSNAESNLQNNRATCPLPEVVPPAADVRIVAKPRYDPAAERVEVDYEVSSGEQIEPFTIRFFWDDNNNRALDPGEQIDAVPGDAMPGRHAAGVPVAVEQGQTRVVGVLLDIDDANAGNNSEFVAVVSGLEIPSPPEKSVAIATIVASTSPELATAIDAVLRAVGQASLADAAVNLPADAWTWSADEPSKATCDAQISVADQALNVRCTLTFDESSKQWSEPGWDRLSDADLKAIAESLRSKGQAYVKAQSEQGELVAAQDSAQTVSGQLTTLRGKAPFSDLPAFDPRLPPRWEDLQQRLADAGFGPAGQPDPKLGYPPELHKDGRAFLLVSLHPNDGLWETAGVPPEQRGWLMFYFDAGEWLEPQPPGGARRYPVAPQDAPQVSLVDSFADAQQAAEAAGGEIPTCLEWRLAALRLHANEKMRGLFDGAYEWCRADDGEVPWVCGGPPVLILTDRVRNVVPPLVPDPSPEQVWTRINHPLGSQPRQYGDGLTAVRPIVRIYPAARD